MIHEDVDRLGESMTLLTELGQQFIHSQTIGVGFHGLDSLELKSDAVDLGLDGGVRVHLHRGNKIPAAMGSVKTFFKIFLGDGQNSCQELF